MFSKGILVGFTVILMTCSSFGLTQNSNPVSISSLSGQVVLSGNGGPKKPLPVLLDYSGSRNEQRTFTDAHGNFEFHDVPKGSYNIRIPLEGLENVNYTVDLPGTLYVFIYLNGSAMYSRGPHAVGGNDTVDVRELTANIPKRALKEYEKAVHEMKYNNTQRAIERLEKSIKLAPDFYNGHVDLAQEYRKVDRLDAAEQELIRASELNSREGAPLIQLGEIYLEKNSFERAAEILSKAVGIAPESALAHYALGRARYGLSEYGEAEQAFTRAALLDEDFEAAKLMLLHAYVRQGKLNLALSGIDALLRKSPRNSRNPALEKFRSEVLLALASSRQGAEPPK